ncbi:hypothetical protein VTH82DRAFT_6905 [Thermothelomyces myriococcoides]
MDGIISEQVRCGFAAILLPLSRTGMEHYVGTTEIDREKRHRPL